MLDRTSIYVGILIGIILGIIISALILIFGISVIGNSFHVETMNLAWNISIPLNETRMVEAVNRTMVRP